uniref:Membrane insertase YidC/Oxa/ALB C-terminal domain-containing protein n=1 Tax=Leersia perrieri TaxID=77586 RepID=A0A0D9XLN3_9ORYZ
MAFAAAAAARRSLASRFSNHLTRRLHPALPHLLPSGDDPRDQSPLSPPPGPQSPRFPLPESSRTPKTLLPLLPFGTHLAGPPRRGFSSASSSPSGAGFDVSTVLSDATDAAAAVAASATPGSFPSEVALAVEGSSLSTTAVQYLIDAVHSCTGLNWWLSIALSTVVLRCTLFPLSIMTMRGVLGMKQEILEVAKLMKSANNEETTNKAADGVIHLLKRLGLPCFVTILSPYSFMTLYFAISNMVEKVPSLKEGGAFWFTDLTTPDALYIFPVMTSLFLVIGLEFSSHYRKTPLSKEEKIAMHIMRTSFLLTAPLTAMLPQAFSCYFVTWSITGLVHRIVIRQPAVKKLLFGDLTKPTGLQSDGSKGTAAEDSTERTKATDASDCDSMERTKATHASVLSSDGSKGPAAKDSPRPIERTKATTDASVHRTERTKTSDASAHTRLRPKICTR